MTIWQKAAWVVAVCLALYVSVASLLADGSQQPLSAWQDGRHQPNIVFILSDDQDLHMDSLSYMPYLKKHITDQGTFFRRHYCTVALCCPSRASLLTGKAAHNTNVTDINPPYGGYPKFVSQGFNEAYLPLWLQDAGYQTYYVGKLLNGQSVINYDSPFSAGWTGSDFLLDPYTYRYLNATFQRNRDLPISHEGQYTTDVVADKAYAFLDDAVAAGKPFFLGIAPSAPHSEVIIKDLLIDGNFTEHSVVQAPPVPAERHKHLFDDVVVPRTPHFNPESPSSVSWISRLPRQNATNVDFNDHFYRSRLRALQALDEIIDGVMARLTSYGILDNTYIVYTTDNGYHIGQHRLQPGKQCPFEEDINIPLMVRGPRVPVGAVSDEVTTHTDLAPTFLSLAGAKLRDDFDGEPISLVTQAINVESSSTESETAGPHDLEEKATRSAPPRRPEHINVESWGIIMSEGNYGSDLYLNHTYKALRIIGRDYSLLYTVWCSGEHELYDVNRDPYELTNLYNMNHTTTFHFMPTTIRSTLSMPPRNDVKKTSSHTPVPESQTTELSHLISRLDALLLVLKTCKGRQCTHPWEYLHPTSKDVHDLHDALRAEFDQLYEEQLDRVQYEKCEKGYILESEGPVWTDDMAATKSKSRRGYWMSEEMAYV